MTREKILQKLKEIYKLKDKHLAILRALEDTAPRPADKLARITEIPLGRLYAYLNELVTLQIIVRTSKKPFQYSVKNFNHAVLDFIRNRMNNYIETESEILDLMKGDVPEQIDLIKTSEDFTHNHIKLIEESTKIRLICFHRSFPFILYPMDFEDFFALRREIAKFRPTISFVEPDSLYIIYRTYFEAIRKGKEFEVIVEKWTLLDHLALIREKFDAAFYKRYVKEITERMKSGKISIRVLEEYLPMEIDIGNRMLVLAISHVNMSTGIVLRNPAVRSLYSTLFDQKLPRTRNFLEYL